MIRSSIILLTLFSMLSSQPRNIKNVGGPHDLERPFGMKCISDQEREFVRENRMVVDHQSMRDTVLFQEPMGNGGMMNLSDSAKHHIWNYVDQNNNVGWILDYSCNYVTYDGHQGTDIVIGGFYYMDEMETPVVAAASGIVTYSHDGEFDRQINWINGAIANGVIISHSDGTSAWYWHFKKNTVAVDVGDSVEIGDTLGFVGSSGFSSGPHLHFEVEGTDGNFKDPWEGQCGDGPSQWADQLPFVGDTNFFGAGLLNVLATSYPVNNNNDIFNYIFNENVPDITHINPGEFYMSGGWYRNIHNTDTLKQRFYRDGVFIDSIYWVPGNTPYWYEGVDYYTASLWYTWGYWDDSEDALGEWREEIYVNDTLLAERIYVCDNIPNQSPSVDFQQISVELGQTITGEFTVTDDGDPFWFNMESEPNNGGSIELYGGRRRKFEYTAPMDFIGQDVIGISATDDRGVTGSMGFIIFDVSGVGLTNLTVGPSFVGSQDSVVISADILGDVDDASILAYVNDVINGDQIQVEMEESDGTWSTSWSPGAQSFFNIDLEMEHGADSETLFYENIGIFTSVGPVTVSMRGETIGNPGDVLLMEFIVTNHSPDQELTDVSVSFGAESMACLDALSSDLYYLGDVAPSDSVGSGGYFFVASINNDCSADSTILINVDIYSGEDSYWEDNFSITIETLGIDGESLPVAYSLSDAYPNPFNPSTKIQYGVPKEDLVSITIHDVVGRHVKTLVSTKKDPGSHTVHWDATNDQGEMVSAGMYFYVIRSGGFMDAKKMILLK